MAWLRWVYLETCVCRYEWKAIGILYDVSMGHGWVRMNADPRCPHHAKP